MKIEVDVSLAAMNTLGIPARASQFCRLTHPEQLPELYQQSLASGLPIRVLGGGSNLILGSNIDAFVIKNELKGITVLAEDNDSVLVSVMAGENWHLFVLHCLAQHYHGLENLALIPGTVGAAPVQNIGAYGMEVGRLVDRVKAIDLVTGDGVEFDQTDCAFSYRDSYFKQHENRYLITEVQMRLSRRFDPLLTYGPLQALKNEPELSAAMVINQVMSIRREKLPDPSKIPNAGSFFKNPVVSQQKLELLQLEYEQIPHYAVAGGVKLAAGWLIDQVGLKGRSNDQGVGCYAKQALVLVNPHRAEFIDVVSWSDRIQKAVRDKFDVVLEEEPRRWI